MALDVKTIQMLTEELSKKLTGGRIEKIQQPENDLLLLTVRAFGVNHKLLIRASGPNARMHLTSQSYENPSTPPMFCMLLRKYLIGAHIFEVLQPNGDRVVSIGVENSNELGDSVELRLVTELLGRGANIILLDSDGRILDCLRKIPPSENSSGRPILPGLRYVYPALPKEYNALRENKNERTNRGPAPCQSENVRDEVKDVFPADNAGYEVSAILDARYALIEQKELRQRHAQSLLKTVRRLRDRQQRKLTAQTEELSRAEKLETVKREAELLQANLYRVKKGDRLLACEDYYDPKTPMVTIPLDPLKTPQENLAARFREYRKVKGAKEHLTVLVSEGKNLLDYLNSVLDELNRAESDSDLEEIRSELELSGLLKGCRQLQRSGRRKNSGKNSTRERRKHKDKMSAGPIHFTAPSGREVLVGRNNTQNDELTTRIARRTDYWLHVKNLHGSHVILRCEGQDPSEEDLRFAASLAARFSQANEGGKVAVDYTMVRNVRKPSGSFPGRVLYSEYRTILAESLKKEYCNRSIPATDVQNPENGKSTGTLKTETD